MATDHVEGGTAVPDHGQGLSAAVYRQPCLAGPWRRGYAACREFPGDANMIEFRFRGAVLALAITLGAISGTGAQTASPGPPPEQLEPHPPAEVSTAEPIGAARPNIENHGAFEGFVDGLVAGYMARDHIAGVTVSIVKDGQVLLAKGYGISGRDPERGVDPARTLFRIGSISKTFTWTAIMQLAEAGRLSLDDPVNDHLPASLKVPDQGFGEPIRIRHLMTHTPGFEDTALGHLFSETADDVVPLVSYLEHFRPGRVRPAGEVTSYSNYGAGLAGAIVAHVSGEIFEDYIDARILGPLGMTRTTFREPLGAAGDGALPDPMTDALAADVSAGFAWKNGDWEAKDFEFITQVAPAGAVSATASDMARYMLAHLRNGELDGARILGEGTARDMHRRLFANAEGVSGLAHGFLEYALPGGYPGYGHGGATLYFLSNMVMVPDLDLGIFVSTNTNTGGRFVYSFVSEFVRRFFTDGATRGPEPADDFAGRGKRFEGTYLSNRRSYTLLEKIIQMPRGFTKVSVTDDGYLLVSAGGETKRYVEIAPLTFREVGGQSTIAFRADEDGDISRLLTSFGVTAGERVGFFAGPLWFGLILALAVVTAIGCGVGWWLRRGRGREPEESNYERWSGHLLPGLGVLWIVFLALFGGAVAQMAARGSEALYGYPSVLLIMSLWIAMLGVLGTVAALASLWPLWRDGHWPLWRRIRHSLVCAVWFGFVLTLHGWNIIGLRYF